MFKLSKLISCAKNIFKGVTSLLANDCKERPVAGVVIWKGNENGVLVLLRPFNSVGAAKINERPKLLYLAHSSHVPNNYN